MRIIHCSGEGKGMFMTGVSEYIVILDDDEVDPQEECCPGFELESVTEVIDLPISLPLGRMLVPRD